MIFAIISSWRLRNGLGTLEEPTLQEREIVLQLGTKETPYPALVERSLFASTGWFDLNSKDGWLQQLLEADDEKPRNLAFWSLTNAAPDRPTEAASILRNWWGDDIERANILLGRLATFREAVKHEEFESLCVDIVRSKPSGLFSDSGLHKREMMLVTWIEDNSERGAPLLKAFFDSWFELNPGEQPFNYDIKDSIDQHSISKLSEKAPAAFLDAAMGAFIRSLEIIKSKRDAGQWEGTFDSRTYSGHLPKDDEFLMRLRVALQEVAKDDPDHALAILSELSPSLHPAALHLHLATVLGNPEGLTEYYIGLLQEDKVFECGWQGAEWKLIADVSEAVFPYLNEEEKNVLRQKSYPVIRRLKQP